MKIICAPKEIRWGIPSSRKARLKSVFYFLIIWIALVNSLKSQQMPNEMWHPGYVITEKGDSIIGNLNYDFLTNLVQVAISKQQVKAMSSQQLINFGFNCQFFNRPRIVYSLPYQLNGSVKNLIFFEILAEGQITLMCREYVVEQTVNNYNSAFYRNSNRYRDTRKVLTYDYYFLTSDGQIVEFESNKKEVLTFFGKYKNEVQSFIKKNKLKVNRQGDLVRITGYYNQLVNN